MPAAVRPRLAWLVPAAVLLVELPLLWPVPHVGDWFYLWFAGHIVAGGGSPYEIASWVPATRDYGTLAGGIAHNSVAGQDLTLAQSDRWLWPPIVGAALAPFGALPLELGLPLLHLATLALCVLSALVLVRTILPPERRPLGLAIAVACAPIVEVMRAANPAAALLPGAALAFVALRGGSAAALAGGATALFARWSVSPLACAGAIAIFIARGRHRALALASAAWVAVNGAAFLLTPFSAQALLDAARVRAQQDNASTWRLTSTVAGDAGAPVALLLIAAGAVLAGIAVRRAAPRDRDATLLAAALALGVAVAPYTRTYDGLALLPAWLVVLRIAPPSRYRIHAVAVGAALAYGWIAYLAGTVSTQAGVGLTPFIALLVLAASSGASAFAHAPSSARVAT